MQMGHGLPVTGRLLALGTAPSIGIDVETNISSEMLWASRFALQVQRGLDNSATNAAGEEVRQVSIGTRQALEWATVEGARAMGLADRTGTLEVGKQADVILIRGDDLNLFPVSVPAETVLYQSSSANVDTVIIAGRIRKQGGVLLHPGLSDLKARLADSGRRLLHDVQLAA
mgnify:FL=1